MPFRNGRYEPDKACKRRMRSLISQHLNTQTGRCKRSEFEQIFQKLRSIETDFFRLLDSSPKTLTGNFQGQDNSSDEAMKNFAIERILGVLNQLYENRYHSELLVTDQSRRIAKKIWKERCKERKRCPRGGVVVIVDGEVVLITHRAGSCVNYGHSKGKIEFKETICECVAREAEEELGLPFDFVYEQIQNKTPIIKEVLYKFDGLTYTVEHYYFIIVLSSEEYDNLRPNKHEIDDVERRSIDTLPCCRNCLENPSVESNDESGVEEEEHSDYYMVSCANFKAATSLVWDIIEFVDGKNGNQVERNKYKEKHRYCQRKIGAF